MNKPKQIVIHHSTGRDHPVIDNWEAIRRYHVDERGWRDIGYHYGIEKAQDKLAVKRGRPPWEIGAHAKGKNHDTLGICLVGDFTEEPPSEEMQSAAVSLVNSLMTAFGISADQVKGHYEIMRPGYTECPGKAFDMDAFRAKLGQ